MSQLVTITCTSEEAEELLRAASGGKDDIPFLNIILAERHSDKPVVNVASKAAKTIIRASGEERRRLEP